jgi:diguanylate cyclase (GGDEF)-like protein/PAS domain S-box-containing protein
MKDKQQVFFSLFIMISIVILLFIFPVTSDYHFFVMQLMMVQIVLGILFYPRFVLPLTIMLSVFHIIYDGILLSAFPIDAAIESFIQIAIVLIILSIVKARKKLSKRVENIIEASRVGTWEWDLVKDEIIVNKRWANSLGYKLDELSPLSIDAYKSMVHKDDLDNVEEEIKNVISGDKDFYDLEMRLKHKEGHYLWVHNRGKVTKYDGLGHAMMMSGTFTDIDEKRRTKDKIKYFHELMTYVIDHMNSGIAVHDLDMNYVYVSQKYLDQYEIDEDIIGKNHYEVFPDLPEKWKKVHQRSLKGEVISADRDPYIHEDGSVDITRWESRPWYNEYKEIAGIIIYTEVINDFIKIEESLREQANEMYIEKEKTQATLMSIGDGVLSTDKEGIITAFNDIAASITGFTKKEALGKSFDDIITLFREDTNEKIKSPVEDIISTRQPFYLENHTILLTKDKQRKYIEHSASPIKDSNNEIIGTIFVIRDVTEEKLKQKEIKYLSLHDYLTGLFNRRFFQNKLNELDNSSQYPLALMMVDVNGLKIINDAYGHETGDLVLQKTGSLLEEVFGEKGIVSRIGGDEFTIILPKTTNDECLKLKDQIKHNINQLTIKNVTLSVSIGYAIKDKEELDVLDILRDAENIMYRFKLIDGDSARNQTIQAIHKTLTDKYELERTHSERVAKISRLIGESLGLNKDDLKELEMSGLFHDIGKISIPDYILYKPARLTKEEFEIIKEHTRNGFTILRAAGEYSDLAENALYHHEHYDGGGYPEGLKGEDIPLQARIICIADAYEAMTADRPYRKGMPKEKAVDELITYRGTQFDPKLVDVFIEKVLDKLDER